MKILSFLFIHILFFHNIWAKDSPESKEIENNFNLSDANNESEIEHTMLVEETDDEDNVIDPEEDDLIAITDTNDVDNKDGKKKLKLIKQFFDERGNEFRRGGLSFDQGIVNTNYLQLGVGTKVEEIPVQEVVNDIAKISHDNDSKHKKKYLLANERRWSKTIITVQSGLKIPTDIIMPAISKSLPISPYIGIKLGRDFSYEITMPTKVDNSDSKQIFQELYRTVNLTASSIIHLKIPRSAKKLLNEKNYPSGSVITRSGGAYFVVSLGAGINPNLAYINLNSYFLIQGNMKREIKIMRDAGKTFVTLTIDKSDSHKMEMNAEAGIGVSLFLDDAKEKYSISPNIRVITAQLSKSKLKSMKMVLRYDLSNSEATEALTQALGGNLIPSEQLARMPGQETSSHSFIDSFTDTGVLWLEDRRSELWEQLSYLKIGAYMQNLKVTVPNVPISISTSKRDPLSFEKTKKSSNEQTRYSMAYSNRINQKIISFEKEKKFNFLWGLLGKHNSHYRYKNYLTVFENKYNSGSIDNDRPKKELSKSKKQTKVGKDPSSRKETFGNQVMISHRMQSKKGAKQSFRKHLASSQHLTNLLRPEVSIMLNSHEQLDDCEEDYDFYKTLVLFTSSIERLYNLNEKTYYKKISKLFGIQESDKWWDEQAKRSDRKKFWKEQWEKAIKFAENKTQKNAYKLLGDIIFEFEKKNFIEKIQNFKNVDLQDFKRSFGDNLQFSQNEINSNQFKLALFFHRIIGPYLGDADFIDIIAYLLSEDNQDDVKSDYYYGVKLKSKKCNINWTLTPLPEYNPETLAKDLANFLDIH